MKKFLNILHSAVALALIITAVSCTRSSASGSGHRSAVSDRDNGITIGFSIDTFVIERWRRDLDVFMEAAAEEGAQVIVQNAGNSEAEQINQIKYLIDQNVDALVIVAKKADSLTEVLAKAKAKNIPVISYDRLIRNADVSLYVTVDSRQVGTFMSQALLEKAPKGGWYCIYGNEDDFNMSMIDQGVRNALDGKPVSVQVKYYTKDWNYDLAYQKMTDLLDSNLVPDAVLCGNDAIAESVIRALREHKLSSIPVAGQDADIAGCQRVVQGMQTATVYKPITELARLSARYACRLARGEKASDLPGVTETMDNGSRQVPTCFIQPVLVTAENMDEVVIQSGFHTYDEVYR